MRIMEHPRSLRISWSAKSSIVVGAMRYTATRPSSDAAEY
jgi:hypothetical protein